MIEAPNPYVGMWVTADGRIRHELLPDGRYDEARDGRAHAYQGSNRVTGSHIDYDDDTGFTADGEFVSRELCIREARENVRTAGVIPYSGLEVYELGIDQRARQSYKGYIGRRRQSGIANA